MTRLLEKLNPLALRLWFPSTALRAGFRLTTSGRSSRACRGTGPPRAEKDLCRSFSRIGILWCAVAVVAVTACGSPRASAPSAGAGASGERGKPKLVTAVLFQDLYALNSLVNRRLASVGQPGDAEAERLVNSGLSTLDNRDVRHPQLAEAFPTTESGLWQVFPDGRMETTWKLRPTARWHDGAPFTAEDVLFTYRVSTDRELQLPRPAYLDSVDTVEALDPLTVRVKWSRPFILADDMFFAPMPSHLLEGLYLENRATFFDWPYWTIEYVGTGPFKLQEFARSSYVKLLANNAYVLGRPRIDEIEIRFIGDPNSLLANFLAGTVDLTLNSRLSLDQVTPILPQWPEGRAELETTSAISFYPQLLNPTPAVIGDVRFRRALMYALDRQEMADTLQGGLVPVAHSLVYPDNAAYPAVDKRIVRYEYDPRRGAQMIEALGYSRGGDGLFRDAAGQLLQVEVRVTAGRDVTTKATLAIGDYWQRAGVTPEPVIVPQQRSQDLEYMAIFPSFYVVNQSTDDLSGGTFTRVRIANVPLPETQYRTSGNRSRYTNRELEALIDQFLVTIPLGERAEVLGQIEHHITDQVIIPSLFFNPLPVLVNNRVQGVTARNEGWNAHLWEVSG